MTHTVHHHAHGHAGHGMSAEPCLKHPPGAGRAATHDHAPQAGHGQGHGDHAGHSVADFRTRFFVSLVLTLPVLVLSPMLQHWLGLGHALRFDGDLVLLFVLSTILYFYGGAPFLRGSVAEIRGRRPGMMTLVALAITTAYIYSGAVVFGFTGEMFFWETATLIDLMLLGHWIEMTSVLGASKALESLAELLPARAHLLLPDGSTDDVERRVLKRGDRVLVKPGETLPADGTVHEGASSVNESMLTGEARPVEKGAGSPVIGGSVNGEGSLIVDVGRTGEASYLSQVIRLVREAQESKSKTQVLANRAAVWLTGIAVAGGASTFFVWTWFTTADFAFALERAVTVVVVACPHALGLAVPLIVAVSTTLAVRNGLLVRNRSAFELARRIDAVVFDKTGTLTEGKFGVTDILAIAPGSTDGEILRLAASVEAHSEHPIARAIIKRADAVAPVQHFRALPGRGAEGVVEGKRVAVVSPGSLTAMGLTVDPDILNVAQGTGETMVFVVVDGQIEGAMTVADVVRPESREAIARLKRMGVRTLMLTGDNRQAAEAVGRRVGIDEVVAGVLPHEKAGKIRDVQSRGLTVAMVGDGINDAPALASADVGIAIGAGTNVAVEAADIILVNSDPGDVVRLVELARATHRKMIQNLFWATGYNVVALPLAAGVLYSQGLLLSPAAGAVLMSLSTVVVAINARLFGRNRAVTSLPR